MLKCLRAYCDKGQSLILALLTKHEVNMAEYLPSSIKDKVKVHKIAKKGTRLISSHLDWTRLVNEGFINDCEFTKIIYMNCRQRHKYESNLHSNEHYLSSSENKA